MIKAGRSRFFGYVINFVHFTSSLNKTYFSLKPPPTPAFFPWVVRVASLNPHDEAARAEGTANRKNSICLGSMLQLLTETKPPESKLSTAGSALQKSALLSSCRSLCTFCLSFFKSSLILPWTCLRHILVKDCHVSRSDCDDCTDLE